MSCQHAGGWALKPAEGEISEGACRQEKNVDQGWFLRHMTSKDAWRTSGKEAKVGRSSQGTRGKPGGLIQGSQEKTILAGNCPTCTLTGA